jgi:hypothetical protein
MSIGQFPKSPNAVHPEQPSAVGSRNSIAQEGRDKIKEATFLVDETVEKVMNHIEKKFPEEVLVKMMLWASQRLAL